MVEKLGDHISGLERQVLDDATLQISSIANKGFALAVNVEGLTPQIQKATFHEAHLERYKKLRFATLDPVFMWATSTNGKKRWSEIRKMLIFKFAPKTVQESADALGMKFGAVIAIRPYHNKMTRSFLSAARDDREFSDTEIELLEECLISVQNRVSVVDDLSLKERHVLQQFADGLTQDDVAVALGVSRATVARMMRTAQEKLGTPNQTSTVARAIQLGLLANISDENRW